MTELVIMKNQQAVTTSLVLAETFEKQHKHVIEAIENKIDSAENSAQYQNMFYLDSYKDSSGKSNKMYVMNRDGWSFIAFGFTGAKADVFKLKYIDAFNQMEEAIKSQAVPLTTREQALLALAANEETNERVDKVENEIKEIKDNSLITTEDKTSIDRKVRSKVYAYCKDHRLNKDAKSMLFQDIGSSIKELFDVPHRGRIKAKDYQRAIDFLTTWEPTAVTKAKISQLNMFDEDIA